MLITTARIELTRVGYNVRELNGFLYADDEGLEIFTSQNHAARTFERHVDRNRVNQLLYRKQPT